MLGAVGAQSQIVCSNTGPANGLVFTIGGLVGNAPAGGTLTTATTGGSIPASTAVYVWYTAVTSNAIPNGLPTNGNVIPYPTSTAGESLQQSSTLDVTTGSGTSTNSCTFTPPTALGGYPIIGWKVYVGSTSTSTSAHYYGFTTGAPLTITSIPSTGAAPNTVDNSATPDASSISGHTGASTEGYFNGILAWLLGTATGTGAAGAAINSQINGTMTLTGLQDAFGTAFNSNSADPDHLWMNSTDLITLSSLLTGNNAGQPYWVAAQMGEQQGDFVAGIRVSRFLNPATGRLFPVNVHAYLPQGTAIALTTELPTWFPGNNVPTVWLWGGPMDYLQIDFQPTPAQVQYLSQMECIGAVHCFLPSQNIAFTGISA